MNTFSTVLHDLPHTTQFCTPHLLSYALDQLEAGYFVAYIRSRERRQTIGKQNIHEFFRLILSRV